MKACIDPRFAPGVFQKLAAGEGGGRSASYLSTHPASSSRVENFKKWMPAAIEQYNSSCKRLLGISNRSITNMK